MSSSMFPLRRALIFFALGGSLMISVYFASFLPTADWYAVYDPATRGVLSGLSPYRIPGYLNPPWAVIPLLPMMILSPLYAHGLMFVTCLLLQGWFAYKLKASPLTFAVFLLSPTALSALLTSNIDPIVISGIFLPPMYGLFFLIIKPQIGFGISLFYLFEIYRKDGLQKVIYTFAPVAIAWLTSALLFPEWIARMIRIPEIIWNSSLFPYSIPLGLFLLWLAFRKKNPYFAMMSSLFFAPYCTFSSYAIIQLGLMHEDVENYIRRDILQLILAVFFWVVYIAFVLN